MSSNTVTTTTVKCDASMVGGPVCIREIFGGGGSNRARAAAKHRGWTHRHWCGTKIDLCPVHSALPLPECESKGGRPKK